jgi:hypothetical protein
LLEDHKIEKAHSFELVGSYSFELVSPVDEVALSHVEKINR